MCGLTGLVAVTGVTSDELVRTVRGMRDALAHRGPDDAGEWIDAERGVALGFRRLAIVDLSPAGHQPMVSASGRYIATLNGEVYNVDELRRAFEHDGVAPRFRGHSDTEVMLAAFDAWGVASAVRRFNGMFAVAVWDRATERLLLIRDRLGVKPLYYGFAGSTFVYGSELKALRQHPDFVGAIDRAALQLYLRFMYVPAPYSIYERIAKLMPGTILEFDPATRQIETTVYWSAREAAVRGMERPFRGSEEDASHEVEAIARDAVRIRMVADVPLGVLLSGGVDSSLVTALRQAESAAPVRTFALGISDVAYDEAGFARAIAAHLGTRHTEVYITSDDVVDIIPKLPSMYDEPFADSSQIPTYLVAALARQHVKVTLSGDGGDELFGGYPRYFLWQNLLRSVRALPSWTRSALSRALALGPPRVWDRVCAFGRPLLPDAFGRPSVGDRVHRFARMLGDTDPDARYFELVSHWSNALTGGPPVEAPIAVRARWPPLADPIERMMYFDQISYLPDDILTKVDRASMAVSLEAREPLLDYRLVELAWTLPLSMKVRAAKGKHVLRRVLNRYIPKALVERPKMGFGIPLEQWLRGRLREWAESLLDPAALRAHGLLDPAPIRATWDEHLAGRGEWKYHLWAILMLQAWLYEERPVSIMSH